MLLAWLSLVLFPVQASGNSGSFQCADAAGVEYLITLGSKEHSLKRIQGKSTVAYPLAAANIGRPGLGLTQLVYNGWDFRRKPSPLDMGTEVAVKYETAGGASRVRMGIVVDHREPEGLQCRAVGRAVPVMIPAFDPGDLSRFAESLEYLGTLRDGAGQLTVTASLAVESTVRRIYNGLAARKALGSANLQAVFEPIKKIAPESVQGITAALPPSEKAFWEKILKDTGYAYYPVVSRLAIWVKEGTRKPPFRHLDSVRAAFQQFGQLPVSKEKDLKQIFLTSLQGALTALSEKEMLEVKRGMDPQAALFFASSWMKANGRKSIEDYPLVVEFLTGIAVAVQPEGFDPAKAQKAIFAFYKSTLAKDPRAKSLFAEAAAGLVQKLTPRQREDLMAWVDEPEKQILKELLD